MKHELGVNILALYLANMMSDSECLEKAREYIDQLKIFEYSGFEEYPKYFKGWVSCFIENEDASSARLINYYLKSNEVKRFSATYIGNELEKNGIFEIVESDNAVVMTKCLCCGYKTIPENDALCFICPICYWEDDGAENFDENYVGMNGISLKEGRDNFIHFGACKIDWIEFVDKEGKNKYDK